MVSATCPIVGIGASAGGLDALKALFRSLPIDSGAAFVVIQHLDPAHESMTAEILARSTAMPTVQVTHGMEIEANSVYVIPPNTYLTLSGHTLKLGEPVLRHGLRLPIDAFFWSLAEQHEERAIAIIVSGTGSDGSLGLRAVKGSGGLVLAQSPDTAQYDGMPRSAIATGLVDVVCPVDEMPAYLTNYLSHPYIEQATETEPASGDDDETDQLRSILALLQTRCGYDFRAYKQGTMGRRIARRMGLNHIASMSEYLAFLRQQPDEANQLYRDLLIGVTAFFRDPEVFAALETEVIADLVAQKSTDESIRVWVPGCASGEEAYSIAMLFIEELTTVHKHCPLQIFATDLDEDALTIGRTGIYPENVSANISPARLRRFFTKEDHIYQVSKTLRDTVTFASQNVISDPPFSKLDLISCRNLLIYLEPDVQRKVLALFHFALRKNGFLLLGHSETTSQQDALFEPVVKKFRLYRRIDGIPVSTVVFPIGATKPRSTKVDLLTPTRTVDQARLKELVQQQLLQEYAPAAVLTNAKHQVLYFNGPTTRYLEQPTGAPTQDLLDLVRSELRTKLRSALKDADSNNRRVTIEDATVKRDERRVPVRLTIKPLSIPRQSDRLLLVIFEDQPEPTALPTVAASIATRSDAATLQHLEYELNSTREDLQSNIEEQESANEELQAANEEVMSVNEELQSTNEELETSKEELQSMNEELSTVNNQLQDKVGQLASSNDDLANFISSTDIATLFLDTELRIGRYTPVTKQLFNLISSDIGRPISDIRQKFKDDDLLTEASRVLDKLVPSEHEVTTEDNEWYLRRILPYRTSDNRIAGVVITFVDITERKLNETAIRESEERFRTFLESAPDALVIVNAAGIIEVVNAQAERLFGYSKNELSGMSVELLLPERFRDRHVADRQGFFADSSVREMGSGLELFALTKERKEFPIEVSLSPISTAHGPVVSAAIRDINERKRSEDALRVAKAQAESALTVKARFLATASHDLRQPLQSLSLLNAALQKSIDDPQAQKMLTMQGDSISGMRRLLNSLLDVTKLESGVVAVEVTDFPVQSIFEQIRAELGAEANAKGLKFDIEPTNDVARSDARLLAQVVQNLTANAIRYTQKGFVKLRCVGEKDRLQIEVSDSGKGIAPNQQTHIFDEFHQVDRDPQERHGGLGLGLSIVQRIADLLGTRVEVRSELDRGSTFSIAVPAGEETPTEPRPLENIENEVVHKSGTILLIDDDPDVLDATEMLLSMEGGYSIATAASPLEADAVLERIKPDLIIADFHLGAGHSGADIIHAARERGRHMIPAILFTGDTSQSISDLNLENAQIMRKPIDADALIAAVRRYI